MNAVTVKNLTRVFRQGDEEIRAVDHVSFTVAPGEMVAIVGQSGSGKTTLLNLIGGIEHPTSGSVEVDGANICAADDETLSKIRRRKLGYIFQDFNLIPILTAEENIIMPLLLDGKKPDKTKLRELAGFFWHWEPPETSAGRALRRTEAARCHRPRPDQRPGDSSCRRAYRESRQKGGRRDHGSAAHRQPSRKHRAAGDA